MPSSKQLKTQWDKMLDRRANWDSTNQEIAEITMPHRSNINTETTPGVKQTTKLYDATNSFSNIILASSMHGSMTNPSQDWFRLKVKLEELNQAPAVRQWLEQVRERILLGFRQSNFVAAINETYLDLGGFGTGCMLLEEESVDPLGPPKRGFRGFRFASFPPGTYAIAENAQGRVDTVFHTQMLSARSAASRWGQQALSEKMQKKLEKDPEELQKFLHCTYPRPFNERKGRRSHPWASVWLELPDPHRVSEGGYHEFPFMVPRWSKTSGEIYGRGPGHTALPFGKSLNKAIELELRNYAKRTDPPFKIKHDGVIGAVDITPSGYTVVSEMENLALLESQTAANFQMNQIDAEQLRTYIRQIFFTDLLLQLLSKDFPAQTATEFLGKLQLLQELLGPTYGRLETELLSPLIDRGFGLMGRAGAFEQPPEELIEAFQAGSIDDVDVEYEGPLARGQRNQEATAIQQAVAEARGIVGEGDQFLVDDVLDLEKGVRRIAEIRGVPADMIRSAEDVQARRDERAAKIEQQEQLNTLEQGARAAAQGAKALPLVEALDETTRTVEQNRRAA